MSSVTRVTVADAEVAFQAPSDTMLTFTVPGNGGGTVSVVLTAGGGTTLTCDFTYTWPSSPDNMIAARRYRRQRHVAWG